MTAKIGFVLTLTLFAPFSAGRLALAEESIPAQEEVMDVEVDADVTDPRGDDESPSPREDNYVCDNVVCGDETKTCTTCGKSDR